MTRLRIEAPRAFHPLLPPSRYKGLHGGRGSAKSHFFAELGIARAVSHSGLRMVCLREVQKDLKDSVKFLLETKIRKFDVAPQFDPQRSEIKTPGGGVIIFQGMQDHTSESIKSLEGFDVAWVEEAQTLSARSLEMLRPTIRKPGSELWFSWNPRNASDPVDAFLRREQPPEGSVVRRVNYTDNPWFPDELEAERLDDERHRPDRYAHIWLGEYEPVAIGAIWDRLMLHRNRRAEMPTMKRIVVSVDPAVSAEKGSDEHGIVVAGIGDDGRGYVLADYTTSGGPRKWAERAVTALDEFEADAIVIERNQGGDMCRHTLQSVRPSVRVIEVTATRGKHVRAEPIAALYAGDRVSHVGTHERLETQMCQMTAGGFEGEGSPDRVDALVWGLTELFPTMLRGAVKPKPKVQQYQGAGSWMG